MLQNMILAILVGCTVVTATVAAEAKYDYEWHWNFDSPGHDIGKIQGAPTDNVLLQSQFYRAACDADDMCLGFNSDGWLKYAIKRPSKMTKNPRPYWFLATKVVGEGYSRRCNEEDWCIWWTTPLPSKTTPPPTATTAMTTTTKCLHIGDRCESNDKGFPHVPYTQCCGTAMCMEKDKSPGGYGRLCWAPLQERYDFFDKLDSPLKDIRQVQVGNLESIASACDWDRECMGFNTNGWLKKAVLDPSKLVRIPVDWWNDSNGGMYTKKVADPSTRSCDSDLYCTWSTWTPDNEYYPKLLRTAA